MKRQKPQLIITRMLRDVGVEESSVRPESIVEWQGTVRTGQGVERDGGEALREEVEVLRARAGHVRRARELHDPRALRAGEPTRDARHHRLRGGVHVCIRAVRAVHPDERELAVVHGREGLDGHGGPEAELETGVAARSAAAGARA